MKFLITLSAFFVFNLSLFAQLPGKVRKMEGLWEYRQGSGFEKWKVQGEAMVGESFRVNKLGDTLIAERMTIKSVNNRLVLQINAINIIDDSVRIVTRNFIGKKRKMEFTSIDAIGIRSLTYKTKLFSRKKLLLFLKGTGAENRRKLVLIRKE